MFRGELSNPNKIMGFLIGFSNKAGLNVSFFGHYRTTPAISITLP